jgi:hypothetical protein
MVFACDPGLQAHIPAERKAVRVNARAQEILASPMIG